MKQILNNLRTGCVSLVEGPEPIAAQCEILIRTRRSLVSTGTEKMLVQFGRASLFQKARSQPERVRQVLAKIRTDGFLPTVESVFRRLDEPLPLGYCNVGEIIALGSGVSGFAVGERVVSNGPHAEIVSVPINLVAKVPDQVEDDTAAFTVIGAIALQGIRIAKPELGETFVVFGLGLIGQITAQLLKAHGCQVIGFDREPKRIELARGFGVQAQQSSGDLDLVKWVEQHTGGLGADGVIITASTPSNEVIAQSAKISRKRGRIVLVGVVGLNINRADFYQKELTFQVSCSYGPGRYEDTYESKGYDYPPAFVRWTENRNFQAVLEAMRSGALNVEPLITRRIALENCREIYDNMEDGSLASLLVYNISSEAKNGGPKTDGRSVDCECRMTAANTEVDKASTIRVCSRQVSPPAIAVIGAGNFTKMTAMPVLAKNKAPVKYIVSSGGVTGTSLAKKYNVPYSSTSLEAVLADSDVRGVIVTTRHNLHAAQIISALRAGKHVLVEKPLCLTIEELRSIENILKELTAADNQSRVYEYPPTVTVGFNRRFSPHAQKMKALLGDVGSISIVATMNAGDISLRHWVHDPHVGGGRLVGEACHYVDLAIYLTGSLVKAVSAIAVEGTTDCASILLRHDNGSTSAVNYFANGHREVSKERIEVHGNGRSLILDNFRKLAGYGFRSFSKFRTQQNKGHEKQIALFIELVKGNGSIMIPWRELSNGTRATLAIPVALRERRWVSMDEFGTEPAHDRVADDTSGSVGTLGG